MGISNERTKPHQGLHPSLLNQLSNTPHLLTPSHWAFGLQHVNLAGKGVRETHNFRQQHLKVPGMPGFSTSPTQTQYSFSPFLTVASLWESMVFYAPQYANNT